MKKKEVVNRLERLALDLDVIAEINRSVECYSAASGYADSARLVRREVERIKEK